MTPLGIRNNNPLNIRRVAGIRWKGELPQTPPPAGEAGRKPAFVQFSSIIWGIRAAYCLLRTYRDKYRLNCPADIIHRWAPPSENDTRRYIYNVCLWTGFGGHQRLTESDWPKLLKAMARQECGIILGEEVLQRGYELYKAKGNFQETETSEN